MLAAAGATPLSIALFPLRRRLPRARSQVDLKSGVSITAPATEPLLFLFREIWVERCYEPGPLAIAPGQAVVDIGAHVGLFSLWIGSRFPRARIIAVEPSPVLANFLRRNLATSGLAETVVVESACGAEAGTAFLYSRGAEMMNTMYPSAGRAISARGVPVQVTTLDELFARHDVRSCALLKLDCEGAEYGIVLGAAPETLRRVRSVVMEYHVGVDQYHPEHLVERLESCGFRVRTVTSDADPVHGYLYAWQEGAESAG
jgi:FkbM family methyltransferase